MGSRFRVPSLIGALATLAVVVVVAVPSATADEPAKASDAYLSQLSGSVALSYYAAHPDQASTRLKPFAALANDHNRTTSRSSQYCQSNANKDVFNCDFIGLPQNEESVGACPTNDNLVISGTNDYNGLLFGDNTTGYNWSTDGGHSVRTYGFLPPVTVGPATHTEVPSGGDPVDFIPTGCDSVYAASLAYDVNTVPFGPNGVAVYKTTPAVLNSCAGFDDPTCWPVKRVVAESDGDVFNDKEWMFVGTQPVGGVAQRVVWVTWTEFRNDENAPLGYNGAQIKAVRCDANLVTCTAPIEISQFGPPSPQTDDDVQFSDVTIGPDGRAYVTWAGIIGELPGDTPTAQTFVIRERTETAPGSGVFGPVHTVYTEQQPIPFGGFLHADDFRIATYPKSDVVNVNGAPRIFVVWDACKTRFLDSTCQEPLIKLSYSLDPDGTSWSAPTELSKGGDNYFPSISADRTGTTNNIAATWFTNYYDIGFHNAQDVQATSINPITGQSRGLKRLTGPQSNEPEADALLGGFFIGDYIEGVLVSGNRYYVGYNANYRQMQVLGIFGPPFSDAPPMNQQDNYLAITGLN